MSQTYISVIIMVLSEILPKIGVTLGSDAITTTVYTLVTVAAGVWAMVRRYQAGGITAAGFRKYQ